MFLVRRAVYVRSGMLALGIALVACGIAAFAQRGSRTLKTRVVMPDGSQPQSIKIRLEGSEGAIIRDSFTDSTGNFEVSNLGTGIYTVVVPTDDRIYSTTTERVEITRSSPDVVAISLYLNPKETASTRRKGDRRTVSAREASSTIPKEARKAYEHSATLAKRGETELAIDELKRAIAIYPNYVQAYNDLGVAYMKLDRIEDAIVALERCTTIDPKAFNPRLNLGIANVRRQDFATAEPHLRTAVAIDATTPLAHLYLGITLWKTGRAEESEDELQRALSLGGSEIAVAHYYLGQLYADRDRINEAVGELEAYLKEKPEAEDAPKARQQIAELRARKK